MIVSEIALTVPATTLQFEGKLLPLLLKVAEQEVLESRSAKGRVAARVVDASIAALDPSSKLAVVS